MDKGTAQYHFFRDVITASWTWGKLSQDERDRFVQACPWDKIKGPADQRIEQVNRLYLMFLAGLGYSPAGWRETAS